MDITFIGTGSGQASLERYPSSMLIYGDDYKVLVDAGDSVSMALLNSGINYNHISGIIFSHLHPDHICGLPFLIVQMKMTDRREKLDIYIHSSKVEFLKNFLNNVYLFEERLRFPLNIIPYEFDETIKMGDKLTVVAKRNTHLDKYTEIAPKFDISLASSSFLFSDSTCNVFYTGDIMDYSDMLLFDPHSYNVVITETTHVEVKELESFVSQNLHKKIYLTHIKEGIETQLKESLCKISNVDVIIAHDGLEISF